MKILIFTEGTILMHKSAISLTRKEIIKQIKNKEPSVKDYASYIPIGTAAQKIAKWKEQGAEISYLTSRRTYGQIKDIKNVLKKQNFPSGELLFRKEKEEYKHNIERLMPDVFIEDDCESIGENEITINHVKPEIRKKIKSIIVKEFGGIDHLPDNIKKLSKWTGFFIIIRGPLGCGKSTIAKILTKKLNAKYVAVDRILDKHNLTKDKEQGYISQKSFINANTIIIPKVKTTLQSGIPIIFDGNFYWKSQIDDLIKRLNFPNYVFTLKAPLEVCVKRDKERNKTYGEDAVRAVYKKSTEFDYGIIIDVKKPLDDCVDEILSYLPL